MGFSRDQYKKWRIDALVLTAAFICIFAYCYFVSRHRILWSDELFGWMLITDPSWNHMLAAWRGGADGGGILFYVLARAWLKLFGRTVLSFRMFSAAGCFLGFATVWLAARRFYRPILAAVSLFLVWFGSQTILSQMVQTRFYGLVLGTTGCCLLASVSTLSLRERSRRGRWAVLLGSSLSNLLLVGSHPFGLLYSAAILTGAAVSDFHARRRRYSYYLASTIPWTILAFSRDAMLNSANVGRPWFWTTRPTFYDLFRMFYPASAGYWPVLYGLTCLTFALLLFFALRSRPAIAPRLGILAPAACLALLPLLVWLISQRGTSYFVERYLIGFSVGIALLLTEAFHQITTQPLPIPNLSPRQRRLLFTCLLSLMGLRVSWYAFWHYPSHMWVPPVDFTGKLAAQLPRNTPIVFERIDVFDIMLAQQRAPDLPMYSLLDWPQVTDPSTSRAAVSGYHQMENWRRFGYFSGSILPVNDFLEHTDRFIAVEAADAAWLKYHLRRDPDLRATQLGRLDTPVGWEQTLWLVEHVHHVHPQPAR